jgi:hypothetical protein
VRVDLDLRTIPPTTLPPLLTDIPASEPEGSIEEEGDSPSGNQLGSEEE